MDVVRLSGPDRSEVGLREKAPKWDNGLLKVPTSFMSTTISTQVVTFGEFIIIRNMEMATTMDTQMETSKTNRSIGFDKFIP